MEYPDPRCEEYEKMAANPDKMGGHGQPNGRPEKPPEMRDQNHPAGSNARAGLPGERVNLS
jgi:hypothetical protein